MSPSPTRIIRLQADNVKRLRAVTITPQGHVVVIGGENGQGKSSVLDAIAMALGGGDEALAVPVRIGEKKASVMLDLGDLVVKRTFTAAGGSTLIVENKDGARYSSPQAILDALTGKLTFDPLAFTRLDGKKQLAALQKIVGLDFTATDTKRKALYEERTANNKQLATCEALVSRMTFYPDAPAEIIDTQALMEELDTVRTHNAGKAALERRVATAQAELSRQIQSLESIDKEITDLEARLTKLRMQRVAALAAKEEAETPLASAKFVLESFEPKDEAPIRQKLAEASRTNADIQTNKLRAEAVVVLNNHRRKSTELTTAIEAIDAEKEKQLAAAKFPVPGLTFGENGIIYNGVPFDQASSAEQLRVSVAMAAALNPKLRVMIVRDGSLLDPKSLTLLGDLAEKHDLQVWVERVSEGAECQVIIEDGAVRSADLEVSATE